jgi:hypothetical protein
MIPVPLALSHRKLPHLRAVRRVTARYVPRREAQDDRLVPSLVVATTAATLAAQVLAVTPADMQQVVSASPGGSFTFEAGPAQVGPFLQGLNRLSAGTTARVQLNLVDGVYSPRALGGNAVLSLPAGVSLTLRGGPGAVFRGKGTALTVTSGNVSINGLTFSTQTASPTLVVTGGSLTLRNATVQGSTSGHQPALRIAGGTADLGTAADPGGNTFNISAQGVFVSNAVPVVVSALGNTFQISGKTLRADAWPDDVTVEMHMMDFHNGGAGLVNFALDPGLAAQWWASLRAGAATRGRTGG